MGTFKLIKLSSTVSAVKVNKIVKNPYQESRMYAKKETLPTRQKVWDTTLDRSLTIHYTIIIQQKTV